ncbi:UNVERIFIED_CONTAM: hypothetical protein PYX00_005825 [Menopon gallinae]|uniref:Protein sleepless n=1 Tax=Menopon gallinae TaxID=328185 RepID=A0AAW2HT31_9NEOP
MKTILFLYSVYALVPALSVYGYDITALYCYQCVSTHPGCATPFNWLWHWSQPCPEANDKCVKIIERKGASEVITRDCLSSLRGIRTDIPADHYEGCRPAPRDVKLANYVNNSIHELDIRRDYYDSIEWCFCYFDNRCNESNSLHTVLIPLLLISAVLTVLL